MIARCLIATSDNLVVAADDGDPNAEPPARHVVDD